MSRIITISDIRRSYDDMTLLPSLDAIRIFMLNQREEDDYLILHIPEGHKNDFVGILAMRYCNEVWIIRQIGPATCIKHREKATPFDCMFF